MYFIRMSEVKAFLHSMGVFVYRVYLRYADEDCGTLRLLLIR